MPNLYSSSDFSLCNFCGMVFSPHVQKADYDRHQMQHGRLSGDRCVGQGCLIDISYDRFSHVTTIKHMLASGPTIGRIGLYHMSKSGSLDELRAFCDSEHPASLSAQQLERMKADGSVLSALGCHKEAGLFICGEYNRTGHIIFCDVCKAANGSAVGASNQQADVVPASKINRRLFRLEGDPVKSKEMSYPGGALG